MLLRFFNVDFLGKISRETFNFFFLPKPLNNWYGGNIFTRTLSAYQMLKITKDLNISCTKSTILSMQKQTSYFSLLNSHMNLQPTDSYTIRILFFYSGVSFKDDNNAKTWYPNVPFFLLDVEKNNRHMCEYSQWFMNEWIVVVVVVVCDDRHW